ncbi:MAG TPA: hypothetical protein VJ761_06905 [Ktedonobacteraceae bacterium]|nr:hypothetical protein [Ktedonobacteraceae bacterium]
MKDTMHGGEPTVATQRANAHKKRIVTRCSICDHRTWFNAIPIIEPPGVPDSRREWTLCTECHAALLDEMRRSPIRSPLRLRIAMGLVAAERSPKAEQRSENAMSDQRWIVVLAWGFGIAMILHLILIVMLAYVAGH